METFIAAAGICLFGLHLMKRIMFLIKNRGSGIRFVQNTVDIFLSMGIFVLSILQILGRSSVGFTRNYTWYILGLLVLYILWAKINVSSYRKNINQKNNKVKKAKYK